jgi:two-component system sensor histidine kinase KdpD
MISFEAARHKRMRKSLLPYRPFWNILFSIGIVILSSEILYILRDNLTTSIVALLYLVPVVISATFWGGLAGITTSVLSFLIFNYYFLHPVYTFSVSQPQDILAMFIFLGVGMLISNLMARAQSRLNQVQAREREVLQLYELSAALTGQIEAIAVTRILAQRLAILFPTTVIEIKVDTAGRTFSIYEPEQPSPQVALRPVRIPLYASKGLLGEILMHGNADVVNIDQERLLQTCASQGAIALERAILAENETRARVIEESDRLKTAILSSVSHELRTPLASIQAAASSLFNPDVSYDPDARSDLQSLLVEEVEHLTQLVGNLLNMSRIEAGALKLQCQWNSLTEIADTSIRRLRRSSLHQLINQDVPDDLPLVFVDQVLMEQVLINLISNSLKFAPSKTPIRLSAEVIDAVMQVSVSNQGPPIPVEYLEHIFEKFFLMPAHNRQQGTGLGLSICKGIVEAHGGKIWAENIDGGVAFRFTLPTVLAQPLAELTAEEEE